MHAAGYSYPEAVAYLRDTHGAEAAITAATWHGARQAQHDAHEIVERAERPPFHAPASDEARWLAVRHLSWLLIVSVQQIVSFVARIQ